MFGDPGLVGFDESDELVHRYRADELRVLANSSDGAVVVVD